MANLSFILADNQDVSKAGLRFYIGQMFPEWALVEVKNENALIEELGRCPEGVVILDYTIFDFKSVADVINLRQHFPLSRWIMFSADLNQEAIRRFANEDGMGIILKDNSEEEIKSALTYAVEGRRFLCHQIANMLLEERTQQIQGNQAAQNKLTATEIEILKLIAHGKTAKEIAVERCSSVHTIITHKKNIFRKIDVNNVYEATKYAIHSGLIDLMEYYI